MDREYRYALINILRSDKTTLWDVKNKLINKFPDVEWVCKVQDTVGPLLAATDKWPLQYISV